MILTNGYDPDVRVYKEAKYLVKKGFDVEILCWDRENRYKDRETEEIDGIKIKRFFPYAQYGTGYRQVLKYIQFIKQCKSYLKNKDYQYMHCHDLDGALAGYLIKNKGSKLIFDMHEFYEGRTNKKSVKFFTRNMVFFLQNKYDYIIYVNETQKASVRESNLNKLIYLPNYPEADNYIGCEKTDSDKLRISYIGAVRQYKELKSLMDASKDMADVEVSIHGAGTAYKQLKEDAENYRNVNVTGLYDFSESNKLYSEADLLYVVYDMKNENWKNAYPVKFFEAIITQTPVIVSKGSILEKFLEKNDIGFVVDGDDVEEISSLLYKIDKNRNLLEEKKNNLNKIQYKYSWDSVLNNFDKIYT